MQGIENIFHFLKGVLMHIRHSNFLSKPSKALTPALRLWTGNSSLIPPSKLSIIEVEALLSRIFGANAFLH